MSWPDWITPEFVEHCRAIEQRAERRRKLDPTGEGCERALQAAENAAHQERALEVMHWMIIGRAIGAFVDIIYEGPGASF